MPSWKAHAQLLARQESHVIDFEVRTTLTLPNGVLPVYFKRRSDDSTSFEVSNTHRNDRLQVAPRVYGGSVWPSGKALGW